MRGHLKPPSHKISLTTFGGGGGEGDRLSFGQRFWNSAIELTFLYNGSQLVYPSDLVCHDYFSIILQANIK